MTSAIRTTSTRTAGFRMCMRASIILRMNSATARGWRSGSMRALMQKLGLAADAFVRVATDRGRSIIVRLDPPLDQDRDSGVVRLDRFVRQALKAHLNEEVEIEKAELGPAKRIELRPAVDVSLAHDLTPHLKSVMVQNRTPASNGAVVYVPFPNSHAGTTYEIGKVSDGPGYVDESTEVILNYHDSHLPDGAFDITFEDVGGLEQADQADPRAGAASAEISATSTATSASIRRAASSFTGRPARAKRISRAPWRTRWTRASITSTART